MLIIDLRQIGNKLYEIRNRKSMSRAEVAEKASLSERTYADIERGSVTMRIDSLLKICTALHITPNDILVNDHETKTTEEDIVESIKLCSASERETALNLLSVYINSLK